LQMRRGKEGAAVWKKERRGGWTGVTGKRSWILDKFTGHPAYEVVLKVEGTIGSRQFKKEKISKERKYRRQAGGILSRDHERKVDGEVGEFQRERKSDYRG